ncbi:S-layer homology domain-containing protein [Paenibacillus alba]|uniref:S-layer homology domain-containing protein n=1 Tax=Paenibacillus alba TaxID=1197127 RepID=UPI0015651EB0|nr:S-layer homology domain-containing protein [Paenibacillus alba]
MTYSVYRRTVMEIFLVVFVSAMFSLIGYSQTAKAAEIPVSEGKSAVASSVTGATYSANQAIDRFIQTKWAAGSLQLPQWLTVDLAQNVHVKRIETVFEKVDSSYQYTIETSADGMNWSSFADKSTNTELNFPYYSDIGDSLARFVRIQVLGVGTPGDGASIYDFRVYTTNEPLQLLSLNKTTAAYSSFSSALGSSKAVDGDLSTRWAPSSTTLPQWLVVDLGQLLNVQRFETTYERRREAYGYKIDFSIDGLTWYTFADRTGNSQLGEPRYVDEGNVTARYFRLTTTSVGTPGTYANVAEFQIYGPGGGAVPGTSQTLNRIALDLTNYAIVPGQTATSYLTATYNNGNSQNISAGATYTISNPSVATVNSNGIISGVSSGTTYLTATYQGKTASASVTVSTALANLNRIAFDTYSYSMQIGANRYPYVIGYKIDGSTQTLTSGITYVSSNPSVASVNTNGAITALAVGSTTVTASYSNFTASTTVSVTTAMSRLEADSSSVALALNGTRYLTINAYDSNNNATNVTSSSSYTSSNPAVVNVNSSGYLSALSAGSTTITVTYNWISTSIYVTVGAGAVDGLVPTWNYGSSLTSSSATDSSVTLAWTAATDNVGVTSYRIYNGSNLLTTVSGSELTTNLTSLTQGETYHFKVEAGDLAENWSATGPAVDVTLQSVAVNALANKPNSVLNGELIRENSPEGGLLSRVRVNGEALNSAFTALNANAETLLTMHLQDYKDTTLIEFPASAFANVQVTNYTAVIRIELDGNYMSIPLLLMKNHAMQAGGGDGLISVQIKHIAGQLAGKVSQKVTGANANLLVTNPMEFQIRVGGNELNTLDGIYVERSLVLPGASYPTNSTAVRVDAMTGESFFVPSTLSNDEGKWTMHIKDQYGGIYTVINANKSFVDMQAHWAQADVEKLASKGIVSGVSGDKFDPEKEITRAEFAALLIRALGLRENSLDASGSGTFQDIRKEDWYAGIVDMAAKAGLIQGYDDGTFRPLQKVSREQMAAMVTRTLQSAGQTAVTVAEDTILNAFKDHNAIDDWAREAMAITLQNGLIQGVSDTKLDPNANATRAQAAVMLNRLLVYMKFIS